MAPLIGKEATEKHFLETFIQLCSSKQYHTRKKCVKSLGNLSAVLGTETTEKHLVRKRKIVDNWKKMNFKFGRPRSELNGNFFSLSVESFRQFVSGRKLGSSRVLPRSVHTCILYLLSDGKEDFSCRCLCRPFKRRRAICSHVGLPIFRSLYLHVRWP